MTPLTDFLDDIMPYVPGCTSDMAIYELRKAVIDFCERTLILQSPHDPVTTVAGQWDYDFDPFLQQRVHKIMRAWYQGRKLHPASADQLIYYQGKYEDDPASYVGTPQWYYQKDYKTFSLLPVPDEAVANILRMDVALKPNNDAVDIDTVLWDNWREALAAGAVARLQITTNKPYSNPTEGAARLGLYTDGVKRAMLQANKSYTRNQTSVNMVKFA